MNECEQVYGEWRAAEIAEGTHPDDLKDCKQGWVAAWEYLQVELASKSERVAELEAERKDLYFEGWHNGRDAIVSTSPEQPWQWFLANGYCYVRPPTPQEPDHE